jgi:hypothetical protein
MKLNLQQYCWVAIGTMLLSSCATVKPPVAPAKNDADLPALAQPLSNIEVPVAVDLKNYFVQAENSVPSTYSDNQQPCEGVRYAYIFKRTPFAITGSNNVINLKFIGSYGISAGYCPKCTSLFGGGTQCAVPVISASCGMGNQPLRRMLISYQSTIAIQPDYHLKSKTVLFPLPSPLDRCNVLFMNIDITDRLIGLITDPLNKLGAQVDDKVSAYNIRPQIEQLWKTMSTEYKLPDMGYLSVNPQSVRISSFNLKGSVLNFSVGISAKPVVTLSSNPKPPTPLPNLSSYTPANGFNIYLDLVSKYDELSAYITKQIAGQTNEVAGKTFIVTDAKVYGTGKQVVIGIDFKGSNTGTVYLVGTPTYDANTHVLSFPDLTFDIQTRSWMIKAAKWMFNEKITRMIREKATYNFTQLLNDSKAKLQSQLSRDMGNNIHSEVSINQLDIQNIYPSADKLILRTLTNGQVKVNMKM